MIIWIYGALFALQLGWLIWSCRKHKKIWPVLICNILSIGLSAYLMCYFDNLPGYGFMPGLSYFAEVFYSLCATVVFTALTFITFLCWLYHRKK